ncbi:MAG: TIGR02302 family protein [Bauldia sp.]
MIDSGRARPPPDSGLDEGRVRGRIERALWRARMVLAWEAIWPLAAPVVALAALFAALSWFGVWRVVPTPVRIAALVVLALAAIYYALRGFGFRLPGRAASLARVERASGSLHRPATAFGDRLASAPNDPVAEALWTAHRQRLLAALDRLRAGVPAPRLAAHDALALRFLVLLLFVLGFVVAGPERGERIAEAFRGGETAEATIARIDAWVTPPPYTGRAPIFLTGEAAKPVGTEYSVPAGSVVTVRVGGTDDLNVVAVDGAGETEADHAAAAPAATAATTPPVEHKLTLAKAADVVVRKGERQVSSWRFAVEPDAAPRIAFQKPPTPTASGALAFAYTLGDDYGVVSAEALVEPAGTSFAAEGARPLLPAPSVPLSLPQMRAREGVAETIKDLTSHPWAGGKVKITLLARDDAAQEGRSEPVEITLPARRFTNPVARAVVEQRARLALDANSAPKVADALDAITVAPDKGIKDVNTYLALRSAYYRLLNARNDDALRGIVDYLWTIALGLEDGDVSLAVKQLRDAQEALRQALENNASDDEIKRLTQELRDALQNFMQAMLDEARRNPQSAAIPPDADAKFLRSEDLERMLDQIENLAKTGARDAARQLLSQLQNMLENLQTGRPMMGDMQNGDQMMQSLDQLGDMIRRQQELMDKTFRADRGEALKDGKPMTAEELADALRQLQEGQQGLQQALKDLMGKLGEMGMGENGKLGQAGEAMGRAAQALGKGKPGGAVGEQGQALDALRQGAQGLAQQLSNRGQGGGIRQGDNFPNQDPLGRPQRTQGPDLGNSVKVPDEIDTQRAREILDSIRKRLGETSRPELELDYLERLLDRF